METLSLVVVDERGKESIQSLPSETPLSLQSLLSYLNVEEGFHVEVFQKDSNNFVPLIFDTDVEKVTNNCKIRVVKEIADKKIGRRSLSMNFDKSQKTRDDDYVKKHGRKKSEDLTKIRKVSSDVSPDKHHKKNGSKSDICPPLPERNEGDIEDIKIKKSKKDKKERKKGFFHRRLSLGVSESKKEPESNYKRTSSERERSPKATKDSLKSSKEEKVEPEKERTPTSKRRPKISLSMFKRTGSELKGIRKATSKEEVRRPSGPFFGVPLPTLMEMQKDSQPEYKYPFILDYLLSIFEKANGYEEDGIFRVTGMVIEVANLKKALDSGQWTATTSNPHCAANLIKQWLKDLGSPLIPEEFYSRCLAAETVEDSVKVMEEIPEINRVVACFFIKFLQRLTLPDNIEKTKMGVNNVAIVFVPFFLATKEIYTDSVQLQEKENREQHFMKVLIGNMKLGVEFDYQHPPEPPPPF